VQLSRRLAGLAVAVALFAAPGTAGAAIVNNGDFETGNLSGWQMSTTTPGDGWFAYTGTMPPVSGMFGNTVAAPPQGNFAAVTDQGGPGLHVLYQDLTLPPGFSRYQLSLLAYYHVDAPIASPGTLDFTGPDNEQYRIEVMRPGAPLDSLASGDILATVFRTVTGDPEILSPTRRTADLSALAGQSVRLRLAEVDNQDVFNASADAISINGLTVGKAKLNKNKGTAKVPVTVTDAGTVTLAGNGVKPSSASKSVSVGAGSTVKLLVKPQGKKKRKLNQKGKGKVQVTITYTPNGVAPLSEQSKVKLKKKT
jgi:hypothetical protein